MGVVGAKTGEGGEDDTVADSHVTHRRYKYCHLAGLFTYVDQKVGCRTDTFPQNDKSMRPWAR